MNTPKITVLMPVYNGEPYLKEAIESILNQTFQDFEFLIINDGSTDKSLEVIRSFNDARIKIIENPQNLGLIATLNIGIKNSTGEYIARMDQDDIALPQRLEKQYKFMEEHPEIGVSGSSMQIIDEERIMKAFTEHKQLKFISLFDSPLCHPSVIIRKSVLEEHNIFYDEKFKHCEDYELWARLLWITELANLPEVLMLYRKHANSITSVYNENQFQNANIVRREQFNRFGLNPTSEEFEMHINLLKHQNLLKDCELKKLLNWVMKIYDLKICDEDYMAKILGSKLPFFFKRCEDLSRETLKIYEKSPFYRILENPEFKIKFI